MAIFNSKYEWTWASAVVPFSVVASLGLLLFVTAPLAFPVGFFFVTFWLTRGWTSLPRRIFAAIAVSIALLWLIPQPSIWLAKHRLEKYHVPIVRAEQRVRPFGNIMKVRADGYRRKPETCDYQCIRYLILPSVDTVTLVRDLKTPFAEIQSGEYTNRGHSVTLRLGAGKDCAADVFEVERSALSHGDIEAVLGERCVVETARPGSFDLILRTGYVSFESPDYEPSYIRADYHDTRLKDGSLVSRGYQISVCPISAPLFVGSTRYFGSGFAIERDCITPDWTNQNYPIDGLDFDS